MATVAYKPEDFQDRAIVAPTNESVDVFHSTMLSIENGAVSMIEARSVLPFELLCFQ